MVDVVEKINELVADVKSLKTLDIESGETIEQVEIAIGSFGIRTGSWNVYSVDIGSSFVLGHPINGLLGSPQGPPQPVLGSLTMGAKVLIASGVQGT